MRISFLEMFKERSLVNSVKTPFGKDLSKLFDKSSCVRFLIPQNEQRNNLDSESEAKDNFEIEKHPKKAKLSIIPKGLFSI